MARGRTKPAESDINKKLIRFCLLRQSKKTPVTVPDAIDFIDDSGLQIDRFWVCRFVEGSSEILALFLLPPPFSL
jgi:hypothetical protein